MMRVLCYLLVVSIPVPSSQSQPPSLPSKLLADRLIASGADLGSDPDAVAWTGIGGMIALHINPLCYQQILVL